MSTLQANTGQNLILEFTSANSHQQKYLENLILIKDALAQVG
jgi:hypothetical protein